VVKLRWIGLASVLWLLGCSTPPQPPDQFYRVYADDIPQSTEPVRLSGVLMVRRFLSDGLVGERSVVYGTSTSENSLFQYHYHHWTESPTRMLQEQLVPYLRKANLADEVVTPDVQIDARYELLGKIRRLEQIRGDAPRVVVELEFALTDRDQGELLSLKSYATEVACTDDSLVAVMDAFNEAVSDVFARLVADVRTD